jgi:hypothetical protein
LQEELVFWCLPYFSVEEHDFDSSSQELFEQQDLVSVVAR